MVREHGCYALQCEKAAWKRLRARKSSRAPRLRWKPCDGFGQLFLAMANCLQLYRCELGMRHYQAVTSIYRLALLYVQLPYSPTR